jgi:hypothetical protein
MSGMPEGQKPSLNYPRFEMKRLQRIAIVGGCGRFRDSRWGQARPCPATEIPASGFLGPPFHLGISPPERMYLIF